MDPDNKKADFIEIDDPELFTRRLTPHRSLSKRGVTIVLACVGGVSFCASLPFYLMGAWPVAGFFGLDVFLLYLAFRASMRSARAYEEIVVTHVELLFKQVSAKGLARIRRFNPSWVQVATESHAEFGVQRVSIVQGREEVEVGRFLGAEEKEAFASAFKGALAEAKRGRRYNP